MGSKPRILVVEDDTVQRKLYGLVLRDYDVVFAKDGVEALHKLGYAPVFTAKGCVVIKESSSALDKVDGLQAAVTDWRMPYLNGFYVVKYARKRGLAVSVFTTEEVLEAFDAGAQIVFTKPIDLCDIKSGIEELVKLYRTGQQPISPSRELVH